MEIVINIPKSNYKALQQMRKGGLGFYHQAILNGTVLPEGHGRLGDLDEYAHCSTDDVPTIIEADKEMP